MRRNKVVEDMGGSSLGQKAGIQNIEYRRQNTGGGRKKERE
jgi:hypothetical protein